VSETDRCHPERRTRGGRRSTIAWTVITVIVVVGLFLASEWIHWALAAGILLLYLGALAWFVPCRLGGGAESISSWRDIVPCYVSVLDRDLRITEANEVLRRDFGECEGKHCYETFKKRDTPCPGCVVKDVMRDGKVRTHRATVVRRSGNRAHIVATTSPLRDDQGNIVAAVETFTDITEIETLRQKVERTREDYQRIFDRLPSYASQITRNLRLLAANALYRKDFGDKPGAHCYEVCKQRTKPCSDCLVARTFEDGEVHSSEETLRTLDGRQVDVVVHSMPVRNEAGEIASVIEVFTDITEVKRLQSKLVLMGRAVAGIAHRIKNIVMGLEGGIFVVNTGMEDSDQGQISEGWRMVEANVERVSKIVKDLLYCSKERMPSKMTLLDPRDVVREVHDLYSKRMAVVGIELCTALGGKVEKGYFDADGLHSMLCNLVTNAIDACRFDEDDSKERHTITVGGRQDDAGDTIFEVTDTGPGIPEDHSRKMFQDFFSTKGTEGTGIGLLVVKTVADEHDGRVTFDTEIGKGTTFRITLPTVKTMPDIAVDPG
jgi:signal transduction histidine kinase